jgi:GTPase SAR1 family protein
MKETIIKLILIGDFNSGKSTLSKILKEENKNYNDINNNDIKNHGINFSCFEVESNNKNEKKFKFLVYDFSSIEDFSN